MKICSLSAVPSQINYYLSAKVDLFLQETSSKKLKKYIKDSNIGFKINLGRPNIFLIKNIQGVGLCPSFLIKKYYQKAQFHCFLSLTLLAISTYNNKGYAIKQCKDQSCSLLCRPITNKMVFDSFLYRTNSFRGMIVIPNTPNRQKSCPWRKKNSHQM